MDFFAIEEPPPIVKRRLKRREKTLRPRAVKINRVLFNSDYFQSEQDALDTIKLRYNFGNEFDLEFKNSFPRVNGFSIFTSIFISLSYKELNMTWGDMKRKLKVSIHDFYRSLRPGGIFVALVDSNMERDLSLQLFTFAVGEMFVPLEKLFIDLGNGAYKFVYVFAKLFYPRRESKYAFKRAFHHQPYNLCTKDREELDGDFHPSYSAFQLKSTTKWLQERLLAGEREMVGLEADLRYREEDFGDLYTVEDNWNERHGFH